MNRVLDLANFDARTDADDGLECNSASSYYCASAQSYLCN